MVIMTTKGQKEASLYRGGRRLHCGRMRRRRLEAADKEARGCGGGEAGGCGQRRRRRERRRRRPRLRSVGQQQLQGSLCLCGSADPFRSPGPRARPQAGCERHGPNPSHTPSHRDCSPPGPSSPRCTPARALAPPAWQVFPRAPSAPDRGAGPLAHEPSGCASTPGPRAVPGARSRSQGLWGHVGRVFPPWIHQRRLCARR